MRYNIIHSPQETVTLGPKGFENPQDAIDKGLAVAMGLQHVKKNKVAALAALGPMDRGIGYGYFPATLLEIDGRPVAGEVEKVPRPGQFPQGLGAEAIF